MLFTVGARAGPTGQGPPLSHVSGLGRKYKGFSFYNNDNKYLPRWVPISAFRSISTSPQKASWL